MFTFSLRVQWRPSSLPYLTPNLTRKQRCHRIDIWPHSHISSPPMSIHISYRCHHKLNNKAGRSGLKYPSISTDISHLSSPGLWHSTLPLNNKLISAVLSSGSDIYWPRVIQREFLIHPDWQTHAFHHSQASNGWITPSDRTLEEEIITHVRLHILCRPLKYGKIRSMF